MKSPLSSTLILLFLTLFARPVLAAEGLFIASAANFILPLEELAATYTGQHGVSLTLSYGSSGKLYAQLLNGAPYDLFLSADKNRPTLLHEQGLCEAPFQYAAGRVVLWSATIPATDTTWQEALAQNDGKIAIASPETAPYGEVPFQALQRQGLIKEIQSRLVFGQSVGQTFLFAKAGAASFGFIALSQALSPQGTKGNYWDIPESDNVEQWGCVPTSTKNRTASRKVQDFLTGPTAQAVIRSHGYK